MVNMSILVLTFSVTTESVSGSPSITKSLVPSGVTPGSQLPVSVQFPVPQIHVTGEASAGLAALKAQIPTQASRLARDETGAGLIMAPPSDQDDGIIIY